MERIWKLEKAVAFILSLTAFIYVGQIISQAGQKISQIGRYQPVSNPGPGGAFIVIDIQTGCISAYSPQENIFYKYDSVHQLFNTKVKE